MNISCSVRDCANPVVGQCTGYQGECRKFYCARHSKGTLCADCSSRKHADELALQIQNDYLQTFERVGIEASKAAVTNLVKMCFIASFFLLVLSNFTRQNGFAGLTLFGLLITCALYFHNKHKAAMRIAAEYDAIKPNFAAFYHEYRSAKNREAVKNGLKIAGGIVMFTAAAAISSIAEDERRNAEKARMRDAVDQGVDDALRRRGL
jgi:hypothetical protein